MEIFVAQYTDATKVDDPIDYDEFENCLHMLERALVFRVMETLGVEPGQARDVCCFCMPAQRGVRGAGSVTSAHVAAGEPRHTLT